MLDNIFPASFPTAFCVFACCSCRNCDSHFEAPSRSMHDANSLPCVRASQSDIDTVVPTAAQVRIESASLIALAYELNVHVVHDAAFSKDKTDSAQTFQPQVMSKGGPGKLPCYGFALGGVLLRSQVFLGGKFIQRHHATCAIVNAELTKSPEVPVTSGLPLTPSHAALSRS